MDLPRCPICQNGFARVQTVPIGELTAQYLRQLGVDTGPEFAAVPALHLDRCPQCDFVAFSPPVTGSQKFYESIQRKDWYYLEDKPEFTTARRYLRPADRVLDVGCGSGAFAGNHPVENYVGLEFTLSSVERARARNLTVFRQGIEAYAPANPASFDAVCVFQVLEHVANQRLFLEACLAACRPGGKLIFSTPNADAFISTVKNCVLNFPPHHTAWFSKKLWRNLPDYFPLRLVEIIEEPLEPVHQRFYADTLARASLEKMLGLQSVPLIDGSLRNKLINRLAHFGGGFIAPGLVDAPMQPKGQSITVVYEKR
jgi:SAM-dependent methyltransferase